MNITCNNKKELIIERIVYNPDDIYAFDITKYLNLFKIRMNKDINNITDLGLEFDVAVNERNILQQLHSLYLKLQELGFMQFKMLGNLAIVNLDKIKNISYDNDYCSVDIDFEGKSCFYKLGKDKFEEFKDKLQEYKNSTINL